MEKIVPKDDIKEMEEMIKEQYEPLPHFLCNDGFMCAKCLRPMEYIGKYAVCHNCKTYVKNYYPIGAA